MGYLLVVLVLLIPVLLFYCVLKSFISFSKKMPSKFLYEDSDADQSNDSQSINKIDILSYLEEKLKYKDNLNESEIVDLINILENKGYSQKEILSYIKSLPQYLKDKEYK
jgi:hypothetical protein